MKTLMWLTLGGSALSLVLLFTRKLLGKRLPAMVYYYAWLLVLIRFCLPVPGFIPETGVKAAVPQTIYDARPSAYTAETEPVLPLGFREVETVPEVHLPKAAESSADEAPASAGARFSGAEAAVLVIWAAGSIGLAAWRIWAYLGFRRKLRKGLRGPEADVTEIYSRIPGRKPKLYESETVPGPLTLGVLSPVIVLPHLEAGKADLKQILAHELMHYRRMDALYKLIAMLALSTQWFNPIAFIALKEIGFACELSCDALLLRRMNGRQKRAYGDILLRTAENMLPGAAAPFYSPKRTLKNRLERIMDHKEKRNRVAAAFLLPILALAFLAAGPAAGRAGAAPDTRTVRVATVDELLTAIAPDTVIELAPGDYDLSTALDYGNETEGGWYSWLRAIDWNEGQAVFAWAELQLRNVNNLTIRASGAGETRILAVPRFANVLYLENCRNVTLEGLLIGHTQMPGECSGGVVRLIACEDVAINACGLFGCGTIGVQALDCARVAITDSRIYECSVAAVDTFSCRDVSVSGCEIDSIQASGVPAAALFSAQQGDGFTVYNCRIRDNYAVHLCRMEKITNVMFLSNRVGMNIFSGPAFLCTVYPARVAGCAFDGNAPGEGWFSGDTASPIGLSGAKLDESRLEGMSYEDIPPETALQAIRDAYAASDGTEELPAGGEIHVNDIEGLIRAIGPKRTVVLADGEYDVLKAKAPLKTDWCSLGADGLVIRDAEGLTLRSESGAPLTVNIFSSAGTDVMRFESCAGLNLIGLGFGKENTGREGTALSFEQSYEIELLDCLVRNVKSGIRINLCATIRLSRLEWSSCSGTAFEAQYTDGISFVNCLARDTASPAIRFSGAADKTWNGEAFTGDGTFDIGPDGRLLEVK